MKKILTLLLTFMLWTSGYGQFTDPGGSDFTLVPITANSTTNEMPAGPVTNVEFFNNNLVDEAWTWSGTQTFDAGVAFKQGQTFQITGTTNNGFFIFPDFGSLSNYTFQDGGGTMAFTSELHSAVTLSGTPNYITLVGQDIVRGQVDLTTDVTGDLPFSNLTPATAAIRLLGRGSAGGAGDFEPITIGSNLTMTGTVLDAVGGAGEANTASNQGSGTNIFIIKNGVDLEFNSIKSENSLLTVFEDLVTNDVELTVNEGSINHDNLSGFVANEHLDWTADQGATDIDAGNIPDGADATAIHDNVAGEIAAVTNEPAPVGEDHILTEDASDSNNKADTPISKLPFSYVIEGTIDVSSVGTVDISVPSSLNFFLTDVMIIGVTDVTGSDAEVDVGVIGDTERYFANTSIKSADFDGTTDALHLTNPTVATGVTSFRLTTDGAATAGSVKYKLRGFLN